jgi:hypothetical protein
MVFSRRRPERLSQMTTAAQALNLSSTGTTAQEVVYVPVPAIHKTGAALFVKLIEISLS